MSNLKSFEDFLDHISDEKLDAMLAEIDAMNIEGPTVDQYFQSIDQSIAGFFDEPSEISTIEDVKELFQDTHIENTCNYLITQILKSASKTNVTDNNFKQEYFAGESDYAMAA
jgi:hypothetical protein